MDPYFNVVYTRVWPCYPNVAAQIKTHRTRQPNIYCLISVSPCQLYPQFPVLSWQERHLVWSAAAAEANLLEASTWCAFRCDLLHTSVVTSGYVTYCWLSVSPDPVWPFSPDLWHQQGIFTQRTAAHWISFPDHPGNCLCVKIPVDEWFMARILKPTCLAPVTMLSVFKIIKTLPFFSALLLSVNLRRQSYLWTKCTAAMWLAN